ncbi:hypothetical protein CR513_13680, partial [Mucuna pruriens]
MNLFRPYLESYKGFKTRYLKVLLVKDAPFVRLPNKVKGLTWEQLDADDRVSWDILNQLPRRVNYKEVIVAFFAYFQKV